MEKGTGHSAFPGGIITFGGGLALYANGSVIGGLGVSGDGSCADQAIAYRMRARSGFDHIPGGVGPGGTDNIRYATPGVGRPGGQEATCSKAPRPTGDFRRRWVLLRT